ncbi:MAG: hypothetical protein K9M80_07795, partial [Candidatus Marinimicrobia bacterium]|nr:hypothetical protein [Candidatus Neomarinimicrobiota bacterium]
WSDTETVNFSINSPPTAPKFSHKQQPVFKQDTITFKLLTSQDEQINKDQIQYKLKIIDQSNNAPGIDTSLSAPDSRDTLEISMLNNFQENGRYLAFTKAYDGVEYSKKDSLHFYINRRNDPPQAFSLINPDDTLNTQNVLLEWQSALDPEATFGGSIKKYRLEISADTAFQNIIIDKELAPESTSSRFQTPENHRSYYWQIFAIDDHLASTASKQTGHFVVNLGNHPPPEVNLIKPSYQEIMQPEQFLIWQQPQDKDRYDRLSFEILITNYAATDTISTLEIDNTRLNQAYRGELDWLAYNYQNVIKLKLLHLIQDRKNLEEGSYYRIFIKSHDNWGGHTLHNSPRSILQFDDNVNTAPNPPSIGMYPDSAIITKTPVKLGWYPATDPDLRDRLRYKIVISHSTNFNSSNYIVHTTDYEQNEISLDERLIENQKYYWRVKSIDSKNAESQWSSVHCFFINFINEAPPKAVRYLAPEDWTELNQNTTFKWELASDPDPGDKLHYLLEIDEDRYFQSPNISKNILPQEINFDTKNQIATFKFGALDTSGNLEENNLYYWRISAVDSKGLKSPCFRSYPRINYNTKNEAPRPVKNFIKIKDGIIVATQTPELKWESATDPDFTDFSHTFSYTVQLSRCSDFLTYNVFSYRTEPGVNSLKIPTTLKENKKWYFRIQTRDKKGATSNWSHIDSFIVNAKREAPEIVEDGFVLRDNMIAETQAPKISWRPVNDNDPFQSSDNIHYIIKYVPSKYLGTGQENKKSTTVKTDPGRTSALLSELEENTNYCYRVRAVDPEGLKSKWSSPLQFIVNSKQEPPLPFELISPLNGRDSIRSDINFQWSRAIDPDPNSKLEYTILISTDSLFQSDVIESRLVSEAKDTLIYHPPAALKRASKYFWKVIAEDNTGLKTQSPAGENKSWMFTTIGYKKFLNIGKKSMLLQNSPNPFNSMTRIAYNVGRYTSVKIVVYNVLGEKVKVLVNENMEAGHYQTSWDGTNQNGRAVPGGMYFCRMYTGKNSDLIKMVLLR